LRCSRAVTGLSNEFFELLTLIQTGKVRPLPILLFGRDFWSRMINFEGLAGRGAVIAPHDLDLFHWCEDAKEAWDFVQRFYEQHPEAPHLLNAPSE
jgi:predicted Rossmann-fold nucleotide-binding protein